MTNIFEFCVRRSLFVNLLSLFLIVAGAVCLFRMAREAFPNISYDQVTVSTDYFGAPAQEIEKLITIKIEDELKEVDGIDEILSVSAENISMIVIRIDPSAKNKRKVVNDIQRAVDRADDLPLDLEDEPLVTELESKNFPVINVSLSGPMSEQELQKHARNLETRLLDIPGVAKVVRIGWRDREIWVEVKPELVNEYRLSLEEVIQALKMHNLNLPGGTLDTPKEGEFLVRTIGEFETAGEIREVIIRANDVGNWIRVRDVAEVKDTFEDDKVIEKTLGTKAITLTVVKKQSGDIIDVVKRVKQAGELFKKQGPAELEVSFFDDLSFYVKRRLNVLVSNGIMGFVLLLLSLLLFLSPSVAVMTAIGIPTSLAFTFIFMNFMGLSINLITMFALIMVLGMLVDDSIIISENIYRYLQRGVPPREAAVIGTRQVAAPVIAMVLTTIAAFIPIFFMKGIIGKFCFSIPLVVMAALGSSLLEALFVLPSHMASFAKRARNHETRKSKNRIDRGLQLLRIAYLKLLRWVIHHRYKALLIFLTICLLGAYLFKFHMKFVLFPQGLIEEFFIRIKAPIGTSLEENDRRISQIEQWVKELPKEELDNFITQVGFSGEDPTDPYSDRATHIGQIHVFLTPEKNRVRKADEIIEELRVKTEPLKPLFDEIVFEKVRAGPPVGRPVNIRIRDDDLAHIEEVAERFKMKLAGLKGVRDVKDDFDPGKKELRVIIDQELAKKNYLSVDNIAHTIRNAIDGGVATQIQKTDEEIDVIVRYPKAYRSAREGFNHFFVPNQFGKLIALSKVASLEEVPGIQAIKHLDRKRMIQVSAELDEKVITSVEVQREMEKFFRSEIMKAYPDVTITYGGEQQETMKALDDFYKALILAVFMIYIILAYMFNSAIQPLVVMVTIPFGILGMIFTFYLHGQPFSFMALLGLIGLSGVVVNDAIVLVDFINHHRAQGWSRALATFAAGRLRLRPVLLTSITTVLSLVPVAYGIGGSDPFVKPMALAIGWGLMFATGLTLLLIPCIYTIFDDLKSLGVKSRDLTPFNTSSISR